MKQRLTIGIDIGGTFTDAVLVDQAQQIIAAKKVVTTSPLERGFEEVLRALMADVSLDRRAVESLCVGTTHATNAILQAEELCRVGIIRVAGHRPATIPPCYTWPEAIRTQVVGQEISIDGGFECDGRPITAFDETAARKALDDLFQAGIESLAVVGVFSPLNPEQELAVAELVQNRVPVSLSHKIGGIGLLERENATVLNACLKKVMAQGLRSLTTVIRQLGFHCPIHITQNDGSLISLEEAIEYPILTLSAGQTNSFIGGMRLTGLSDCVVVDIGGTSTDVGLVKGGILQRSLDSCSIGGITLNFPMPDVLSIALGGGSHVASTGTIGPQSSARKLFQEGQAFGGNTLTFTDVALKLGIAAIQEANIDLIQISCDQARGVMESAVATLRGLVETALPYKQELPVVLVGGGASLFAMGHLGAGYIAPNNFQVANAYGAALAEISAKVDCIVSLEHRQEVLEDIKRQAVEAAIDKGACPQRASVVDIQLIPYHYMPGNKARVIVTASGPKKYGQ